MAAAASATNTAMLASTGAAVDNAWIMFAGALVFFMHAGFTLVETGCARACSLESIIMKNLLNMVIGALGWWSFGYAFAFGEDNANAEAIEENGRSGYGGFIGTTYFFTQDKDLFKDGVGGGAPGSNDVNAGAFWFFQFTFCATGATIISGAIAERANIVGFAIVSMWMTSFVYPIVVHWTWGYGWLYMMGYTDFAGSGIVHLCGGWAAVLGATIIGPRLGRFDLNRAHTFAPSSVLNIAMGTFFLWFGWYGFNGGSAVTLVNGSADFYHTGAARAMVNTTLGGACGGLSSVLIACAMTSEHKLDLATFANGILAGLVAITASCAAIDMWAAVLIGLMAGPIFLFSVVAEEMLKIDDIVGAYPVHGANGIWGVLATGLFRMDTGAFGYHSKNEWVQGDDSAGCFVPNLVGILAIMAWTTATCVPVFLGLKYAGILRISLEKEQAGIDAAYFGSDDDRGHKLAGLSPRNLVMSPNDDSA